MDAEEPIPDTLRTIRDAEEPIPDTLRPVRDSPSVVRGRTAIGEDNKEASLSRPALLTGCPEPRLRRADSLSSELPSPVTSRQWLAAR